MPDDVVEHFKWNKELVMLLGNNQFQYLNLPVKRHRKNLIVAATD